MSERHVSGADVIECPEDGQVAADGVARLNTHQAGDLRPRETSLKAWKCECISSSIESVFQSFVVCYPE